MIRTLGIVGYGAFGTLLSTLAKRFVPNIDVRVYSLRKEPDGVTFFSLADTASSDVVVLAVPIHAFENKLKEILPLMRTDGIIVDVATVKAHTVEVLRRLAGNRRWIATHPMWGPESYKKKHGDVTGFRVVITEHTLEIQDVDALSRFLSLCGFTVVSMNADQHDIHLAETLFLTHFIGQIIARSGFDRTPIDTASFGYIMDAVESVKNDEALFRDVFRYNPYCKEVLERFGEGEEAVRKLLG